MPCYHPMKAMRSSSGVVVLPSSATIHNLLLPCGQCHGCRLERSRQWAIRCMHEASLHDDNCFITLTYSDEHCPTDGGLHHKDFQRFMKRLRKYFAPAKIRFYMAGEYGGKFGRPHFHAILFGINFADREPWQKSPSGSLLYRSALLERLWPFGYSSLGDVTFESAAYVARYVMKKVTGDLAKAAYEVVATDTGEVIDRRPDYNAMSLKPGIGADWFKKFKSDVFPHDRVVVDGSETKPPRYYDKLLKRVDPDAFDTIKMLRAIDNADKYADNTPDRLAAKEAVSIAATSQLKRKLS